MNLINYYYFNQTVEALTQITRMAQRGCRLGRVPACLRLNRTEILQIVSK
jgi:hypothetical protein